MLVGLCGGLYGYPAINFADKGADVGVGVCAGKQSVADYLVQNRGFQLLQLNDGLGRASAAASRLQLSRRESTSPVRVFQTIDDLINFATLNWREHWILTDIRDHELLEKLFVRPFFLLISVDAPISLRWRRFSDR